jgi:hypothetical protein
MSAYEDNEQYFVKHLDDIIKMSREKILFVLDEKLIAVVDCHDMISVCNKVIKSLDPKDVESVFIRYVSKCANCE